MIDDLRECECIVSGVLDGKHGPYAVATCDEIEGGTITFSCKEPVWTEKHQPKPGEEMLFYCLMCIADAVVGAQEMPD